MSLLDAPPVEPQGDGPLLAPSQTVGAQPAELQTPVRSIKDLRDAQMSNDVRNQFDSASQNGDWESANNLYDRMRQMAGQASTEVMLEGGDPRTETRPIGMFAHPSIEAERRGIAIAEKAQPIKQFLQEDEGFKEIQGYMNGVMEEYKGLNETPLQDWKPDTMTEQQKHDYMLQLQPVRRDPNEIADMRQALVKMDQRGKAIDPEFSVFTHPSTRKWAGWLNREAGGTGMGYLQSTEKEMELGAVGRAGMVVAEAAESMADPIMSGIWQLREWQNMALDGMGLGMLKQDIPYNYIEGPNGEVMVNDAKPHPGLIDIVQGVKAAALGQDVAGEMAKLGRVREFERSQRHGWTNLAHGIANTAGAFAGFGMPAGAAMQGGAAGFTAMSRKGLGVLAGLGVKGAESQKMLKYVDLWSKGVGGAAGQGAFQATAYGKQQGYTNEFLHGMAMFPALAVLGKYGNRMEKALERHAKMPSRVAAMLSEGMAMGVPFATLEMAEMGLWEHLKNPNESTFDVYMRNIMGAMLFKGAAHRKEGVTPMQEQASRTMFQRRRGDARATLAKEVYEGKRDFKEVGDKFENLKESDVAMLGELHMRKDAEQSLTKKREIAQEISKVEKELDIKEYGLENAVEAELKQITAEEQGAPQQVGKQFRPKGEKGERYSLHDRITEQRRQKREFVEEKRVKTAKEAVRIDKATKETATRHEKEVSDLRKKMDEQIKLITEHRKKNPQEGPWSLTPKENVEGSIYGPKVREMEHRHRQERAELAQQKKDLYPGVEQAKKEGVGEEKAKEVDVGKRISESQDPLDRPDFTKRPEAERQALMAAKTKLERQTLDWRIKEAGGISEKVLQGVKTEHVKLKERLEAEAKEPKRTEAKDKAPSPAEELRMGNERRVKSKLSEGRAERRMGERREKLKNEGDAGDAGDDIRMAGERSSRIPTRTEREQGAEFGPGSQQVAPGRQVEAVEGAKRTTLDDIYAEFSGRLPRKGVRVPFTAVRIGTKKGDPVRPARAKGRIGGGQGVQGLYKIFENLIRTRGGRELVTFSHEWSHAMQRHMQSERGGKEFTDAARQWEAELPSSVKAEFPAILEGYANWQRLKPARQGMEVWAEWHARELLGDARLETEAPKLTQYFREQLADPMNAAVREQFTRIKDKILNYTLQGARGRLEASIADVGEKPSVSVKATQPTRLERARDKVLRSFFEDNIKLRRGAEKWLEASGREAEALHIMEDPARLWDALRMTAHKQTEQFVMKGITMPDGTHTPGMKSVLQKVKGRERDFRNYLVAVVNAQRIMKGKKATLSKADYVSEIRRIQQENPDFIQARRDLKAWTDTVIDWVAGAGNLPAEQAQRIKDAYVAWVPFMRIMDGPPAHISVGGRSVAPTRTGIGRAKGGTERIQDPFMAMFDSVASMISNAHRNMVMGSLYKMAVGKEAGGIATVVPKTKVPVDNPLRQILDAMDRQVKIPTENEGMFREMISALKDADALDPQTVTLFSQKTIPTGEKNIVAFTPRLTEAEISRVAAGDPHLESILRKNQDKNLWLEINDPQIYETLMGLDVPPMHQFFENNLLGQALKGAGELRRMFATGLAPGFTVANLMRDAMSQPMFTRDGKFRPGGGVVDVVKGAWLYHGEKGPGSIREMYDASGVKIASFFNQGTRRKIIGESRTVMQKTKAALDRVQEMFATPENYLRISEFKKTYDKAKLEGATEREARTLALEAGKEITVNFARGGVVAKLLNPMIPYFNAGLQGQRKLYKQIVFGGEGRTDAERARIQRGAFMNGIANITVPTLIAWWMNKDQEWYQDLPEWKKMAYMHFDIGGEIISIPKPFEAGVLFGTMPEMAMDSWVAENGQPPSMYTALQDGLFPYLKGPGEMLPALIQPVIEMKANFDFFRGRALTPYWIEKGKLPEDQATFYTSESAKIMSRAMNGALTPIEIEKLIGGYTSGSGTYALRTLDEISQLKNHPGLSFNPMQRFFTDPHRSGYFQNDLYRVGRDLDRKSGSKVITPAEKNLRSRVNKAKKRFSEISRSVTAGALDRDKAEELKYQIARPLVERYEEMTK